ncbi:MAG: nucleotide-binding protein [Rheinheimera sp.]|nr:nucleotide-binding protein [Rheinheimera sp.]
MYLAELTYKVIADTSFSQAEATIRAFTEALIFNGNVLGREFPTAWQQDRFCARLVIPAADALQRPHLSARVLQAEQQLMAAGLAYPQVKVLGMDIMSQHSSNQDTETLVLFTTFSDNCSPLRNLADLAPVPLYQLLPAEGVDHESLIRWQIQFQALEEVQQQQQRVLKKTAENSLQQFNSALNRQGRLLAKKISQHNALPVYYAMYSGSSNNCAADPVKPCPGCGNAWRLTTPLLELFDFKCDRCQLVSNIAWECQTP